MQSHPLEYVNFLYRYSNHLRDHISTHWAVYIAASKKEAGGIYRELAGLWASRGFYEDSAWAYTRAKSLERKDVAPIYTDEQYSFNASVEKFELISRKLRIRWSPPRRFLSNAVSYTGHVLANATSAYGTSYTRAIFASVFLVFGYAIVFFLIHNAHFIGQIGMFKEIANCVRYSLLRFLSFGPENNPLSQYEVISAAESGTGVVMLGLLGFVIGNRVRNW